MTSDDWRLLIIKKKKKKNIDTDNILKYLYFSRCFSVCFLFTVIQYEQSVLLLLNHWALQKGNKAQTFTIIWLQPKQIPEQ